jgi:tetratricopeptide (TPR) repeat protein
MPEIKDHTAGGENGRNQHDSWKKAKDRLLGEVWPATRPSFQIEPGAKVFTIGSCFARNIEKNLQKLGFNVPTLALTVPPREEGSSGGILNKYTPAAIFQELKWARDIFAKGGAITEADSADFLYEYGGDLCIDTNLKGFVPVTRERFFQRRREVYEVYQEVFSADCVVMTLGLVEAWFDREKKVYIQQSPSPRTFPRGRERFSFERLTYAQCHQFIQNSIAAIREINPEAKFLITTSPVALSRTFTDEDVIVANMHSKSVLRAVAGEVSNTNNRVDYFPSYESVVLTKSWSIWRPDLIHVSDEFVGKVVARLVDNYCAGVDEASKLFQQSHVSSRAEAAGALEEALEFAHRSVKKAPENADLLKHLGELLARQGDLRDAEVEFVKAVKLRPRDAILHHRLSDVLARQGRIEEALQAGRRSIELAPDHEEYHRHVGRLWIRQRRLGKAAIELALAACHRRLQRTKRRQLKRVLRVSLPLLQKMSRLTYST